ncbi:MAG: ribonuclease E/G, partial [Sandaracinaceae bacterium]|nr:ribonuclease E/G [Sandaracinaceae bacterium]
MDVGETRVALIENGILAELYVERERDRSPVGNVYLGKVTRVLPGMQAAFVDIGLDRAAFLHVEDVIPTKDFEQLVGNGEEEAEEDEGDGIEKHRGRVTRKTPIRDVLKEGQQIVVQVSKGPISTKGARVTSHVSLPGRYAVYMPTIEHVGVSKRIGNERERKRLRDVIDAVKPPHGRLIVRTVAQGLTKGGLKADVGYLVKTWGEGRREAEEHEEGARPA